MQRGRIAREYNRSRDRGVWFYRIGLRDYAYVLKSIGERVSQNNLLTHRKA